MSRNLAADLVISWDDEPIFAEQLDARRDFWVGHADAHQSVDFEVAEGTLSRSFPFIVGRRRPSCVTLCVPDEIAYSGEGFERVGEHLRLPLGAHAWLQIGRLSLRVRAIQGERKQRARPRPPWRLGGSMLLATALVAGLIWLCFMVPPEPVDDYGMTDSQRYLIQQYLEEAAEEEETPELWTRAGVEGGTGSRYIGPDPDPHIARQAALRDAAQFGMIGLLNSGAGGDPDTPMTPWGTGPGLTMPDAHKTWKRSQLVPHSSKLMVGDKEALPLETMQAQVTVDGFRARVVLDYEFENPHARDLEGRFKLRLPDGASPYFLAFGETAIKMPKPPAHAAGHNQPAMIMAEREQTWRKPKEARMVPRVKAMRAFEETVRRQVDPALLEWAGAGIFNARVFPIESSSHIRVVVGYDVDLNATAGDLQLSFDVPKDVPEASVAFDVADVPNTSVTVTPATQPIRTAGRSSYRFSGHQGEAIELRLKHAPNTAITGGGYFAATFEADLPTAHVQGNDKAVLLVDTSLSSNPDAYRVWLALLEQLLEKNRDTLDHFAVLFFNVESHWWRNGFSRNTAANVAALMQYARTLSLEGATDLGMALRESVQPRWLPGATDHDVFLLSDGGVTWGDKNAYALSASFHDHPGALFAYRSGLAGGDTKLLAHVTREARGAVFAVTGPAEIAAAATAHRQRPWHIVSATMKGAADIMLAGRPTALFPGQRIGMVGRGAPARDAHIELVVQQPDAAPRKMSIPLGAVIASPLAERAYGQIAVRQLEALEGVTAEMARAYALHFRVPGNSASLLMLDTEADYARYDIKPAENGTLVRTRPASRAITHALKSAASELGQPKAMLMQSLSELKQLPGVRLTLNESTQQMIADLHPDALRLSSKALTAQNHHAADLPKPFRDQLANRSISYDDVVSAASKHQDSAAAVRTLSSLIELNPGDAVLQRDIGYSAMQLGRPAQAFGLFRRVATARPHEPQSYRAMARALAAMKRADLAMIYFEIALHEAWHNRYPQFSTIVAMDYVSLLRRIDRGILTVQDPAYARRRLSELTQEMQSEQADLVVMISWNTNNTDVDLHILEPSGEECMYSHPNTRSGGQLTRDITTGFGPEMYRLPNAPSGQYRISAHYFASEANRLSARTKVHAVIIEGYGTPRQRTQETTITLKNAQSTHNIATITVRDHRVTLHTN